MATPVIFDRSEVPSGLSVADFSDAMDKTPLSVHLRAPVEYVLDLFKKIGPRYVVVKQHGRLMGLITKKDLLVGVMGESVDEDLQDTLSHMSLASALSTSHVFSPMTLGIPASEPRVAQSNLQFPLMNSPAMGRLYATRGQTHHRAVHDTASQLSIELQRFS